MSARFDRRTESVNIQNESKTSTNGAKRSALKSIKDGIAVRKNEIRDIEDVLPKVRLNAFMRSSFW